MAKEIQMEDLTQEEHTQKYITHLEIKQEDYNNMKESRDYYMKKYNNLKKEQEKISSELIHKRMNDINTFQAHKNELYLRGKDEYGKDFQVCFDSYDFLEWIDTENLEYIKEKLSKYIKEK